MQPALPRLRPGAVLEEKAKVGNFVEVKKATLGKGAKANHLSYIGDAEVGAGANIGAGTITCNYDGYFKYKTVIGERAFIGSNSALVAPVRIGADAIVGAGSAVTRDVADGELRIVRAEQLAKLAALRADRDEAATQAALADLTRAAGERGGANLENNLMALAINAARAKATVGEISDALEKVYGRHQAEIRTIAGVYRDEVGKASNVTVATEMVEKFAEADGRRPRILVAKMGQDGHDRGQKVIATAFADIGFDVDVGSLFSTPDEVAQQAADNDVHVVGVSSLAAGHLTLVPALRDALAAAGRPDIMVVVGGVIPPGDFDELYAAGATAIFPPGTVIADAAIGLLNKLADRLGYDLS